MPMLFIAVLVVAAMSGLMALAYLGQRALGNAGWTDAFWGLSVGVSGTLGALVPLSGEAVLSLRRCVIAAMIAAWSLRLFSHIAARSSGGHEDPRYAKIRAQKGEGFDRYMFGFLQIQGVAGAVFAIAAALAAHAPLTGLDAMDGVGLFVIGLAVIGEAVADAQLRAFKASPGPRGRVCDVGLWAWSRHPNYVFEWLVWVGFCLMSLHMAYPIGLVAIAAPAFSYYLLRHVSGVPLLEDAMLASRGEAYRTYQARVGVFFPRLSLKRSRV